MSTLVFYSDFSKPGHYHLDEAWTSGISRSSRITYVPSCGIGPGAEQYYSLFQEYFKHFGFKRFHYFVHDTPFGTASLREAFSSEIVFLSGGNTFYFAHSLRRSGVWKAVISYAKRRESILVGMSAGGILFTPSLRTSTIGPVVDPNEVKLKDFRGLATVPFHFLPHFDGSLAVLKKAQTFRRKAGAPLVACPNGSGVIVSSPHFSRDRFARAATRFVGDLILL